MHEISGSQFFRNTTGIQSGPEAFDESKLVITFLTIFGAMEILSNFRPFLEGKTGLEFLGKLPANNFALSDAEDNTSGPLNREEV